MRPRGGRVVPVHALVATGVNADGHHEILGIQVATSEDGAGWLGSFRDLTARGPFGVKLVTSDAHAGPMPRFTKEPSGMSRAIPRRARRWRAVPGRGLDGRLARHRALDGVVAGLRGRGATSAGDRA
jgi:hypothetical protein